MHSAPLKHILIILFQAHCGGNDEICVNVLIYGPNSIYLAIYDKAAATARGCHGNLPSFSFAYTHTSIAAHARVGITQHLRQQQDRGREDDVKTNPKVPFISGLRKLGSF